MSHLNMLVYHSVQEILFVVLLLSFYLPACYVDRMPTLMFLMDLASDDFFGSIHAYHSSAFYLR